jgi:hypothetical protein
VALDLYGQRAHQALGFDEEIDHGSYPIQRTYFATHA